MSKKVGTEDGKKIRTETLTKRNTHWRIENASAVHRMKVWKCSWKRIYSSNWIKCNHKKILLASVCIPLSTDNMIKKHNMNKWSNEKEEKIKPNIHFAQQRVVHSMKITFACALRTKKNYMKNSDNEIYTPTDNTQRCLI